MTVQAFTASDGARIAYRIEGAAEGPVVLLSNSLGATMSMWQGQMAALSPWFRVVRYDSRGHGLSSGPPGDYSIARLARDVVELLDSLSIERAAFCGLSMGGMVGQWLGAHAADRLSRLILCNTSAFMGPEGWSTRMQMVRSGGMPSIVDKVIERWFTKRFVAANPAVTAAFRRMLLKSDPKGYASCCAAIRDMDQRQTARTIAPPCLVIGGLEDQATPPSDSEWLAAEIPNAELALFAAAHLSNVEGADDFNQRVCSFLQPLIQDSPRI
jgi:3-oxoadipate enol-lactonase